MTLGTGGWWCCWLCALLWCLSISGTCALPPTILYWLFSWNRFWHPETFQIVQELEQQGKVPDTTSQSYSRMLEAEKLKPGPPLTAYYMNQVRFLYQVSSIFRFAHPCPVAHLLLGQQTNWRPWKASKDAWFWLFAIRWPNQVAWPHCQEDQGKEKEEEGGRNAQ